jgi:mono/diheme cytochrome c family protein
MTGAGGANTSGSGGTSGGGSGGATMDCANALPATVQAMLSNTCIACHGKTPLQGVPTSLTGYADLVARSASDPTMTNAELALQRLQDNANPMPPAPLSRASAADIAALKTWVTAGMPMGNCGRTVDGGVADAGNNGSDGGTVIDPFSVPAVCTSKKNWTGGNRGNQQMNPGLACIACHSTNDGPKFTIAGTLYPTAHEPDLCNGVSGSTGGAQVVIVGANGQQVTLTPNAAGNFDSQGNISKPYKAKVVYMGRERAMIEAQTSGDCNNCHTQDGDMPAGSSMKAPGRILLP